jgi:XTP/dITP diphosphohydrolase
MKLLFASQNRHKMEEIKPLLPESIELLNLTDLGFSEEIPETSPTLEGNALQKANFIFDKFNIPCFADDTGLEVDALDGRPGVYSARYALTNKLPGQAGEGKSADDNIQKLLGEMQGVSNRAASFRTVIALVGLGQPLLFEGSIKGFITKEKHGSYGFGYDPVFLPEGYVLTFAEMSLAQKNALSHRGRAVRKFGEWLKRNP